jgi:hypothetical protein
MDPLPNFNGHERCCGSCKRWLVVDRPQGAGRTAEGANAIQQTARQKRLTTTSGGIIFIFIIVTKAVCHGAQGF